MKYLTHDQILLIHSFVIDETGGSHGVREKHAISSLEHLPSQTMFGKELYGTIFIKAAVYARSIIMNHPFIDGNKRTGMTAAYVFLENNGYKQVVHEGDIECFALKIITDRLELPAITSWFKKHSRKQRGK